MYQTCSLLSFQGFGSLRCLPNIVTRVSPFCLKIFSLISEIKRIWIRFTCVSLFHYKISLLFFHFFLLIFTSNFSLCFTWVIFASKRNKAKRNQVYFFAFFRFFSLFFAIFRIFSQFFFAFFRFKFFASLRFSNFASKRNKVKQNSSLFFAFFAFFTFFRFFSLNFCFASIFSLNFCLFYLRFRFRFLVFRIEVNHVKSGFFFASKRNEIFASISNFASEARWRRSEGAP